MAPGSKSIVFRVTGIPAHQTDEQLTAKLRSVIEENLQEEERSRIIAKINPVPSCQKDEKTSVALVEFIGGTP
jgi:hypothetical protein